MDYPSAYARQVLVNLVFDNADRRSQRRSELAHPHSDVEPADESAARTFREVDNVAEFRWALAPLPVPRHAPATHRRRL